MRSGTTESPSTTAGLSKVVNLAHCRCFVTVEYQLGDPIPARDAHGFCAQVLEDHLEFAAEIGINRSWAVGQRNAPFESQTGPRSHLALDALWHFHGEPRGNGPNLT